MSWGSWLFISCWREEKLNLSKVWFGSMSQSCGMKDALCFHQTLTAMLRSYERTWWNLWKEFASKETCCYIFFSGYLKSLEINDCFNLSPGYSYKVIKIFLLWLWFQVTGYMNNYAGQILVLHNLLQTNTIFPYLLNSISTMASTTHSCFQTSRQTSHRNGSKTVPSYAATCHTFLFWL